ncbi:winged helix-turn-helix transcriptional regulator [Geoglobus sp.]
MDNKFRKQELNDPVNKRIIEGLINGQTLEEIAESLGIAVRTVQNRMKQLERREYIREVKKGVWQVDYQKIGLDTIGVVLISMKNDREGMRRLVDHLKRLDYVENVFEIVGSEYDLCIIVRFSGLEEAMDENDRFISWLNRNGIRVDEFKAFISGRTHKDHRRTRL